MLGGALIASIKKKMVARELITVLDTLASSNCLTLLGRTVSIFEWDDYAILFHILVLKKE